MASRHPTVLLGVLFLVLVVAVGVASAHGSHVTANPQASANGSLVVEEVSLAESGYLALRADGGGSPGRVVGVRSLDRGRHIDVRVRANQSYWRSVSGNATVWATLYAVDGDRTFDPDADPRLAGTDGAATDRFVVGKRDGAASVVVDRLTGDSGPDALQVAAAVLPANGHLVVHRRGDEAIGRPLGSVSLAAGRHTDVRVPISLPAEGAGNHSLPVTVAVHADDGDGRFQAERDRLRRVDGAPVASDARLSTVRAGPQTVTDTTDSAVVSAADDSTGLELLATLLAVLLAASGVLATRRRTESKRTNR